METEMVGFARLDRYESLPGNTEACERRKLDNQPILTSRNKVSFGIPFRTVYSPSRHLGGRKMALTGHLPRWL